MIMYLCSIIVSLEFVIYLLLYLKNEYKLLFVQAPEGTSRLVLECREELKEQADKSVWPYSRFQHTQESRETKTVEKHRKTFIKGTSKKRTEELLKQNRNW